MRPGRFRLGSAAQGQRRTVGVRAGFNEARAFPPGKWPAVEADDEPDPGASMRPGRFRLGSVPPAGDDEGIEHVALQ